MNMDDLDPDVRELGMRLERERPLPRPAFRGDLGRRLAASATRRPPRRLRLLVAAQLGAGALLLGIAAVGVVAQAGPLAL